jgi:hypothetical protein
MNLRTGDKVTWESGSKSNRFMTGVVLEDLGNGLVDIISHSNNGLVCTQFMQVAKDKLKLYTN